MNKIHLKIAALLLLLALGASSQASPLNLRSGQVGLGVMAGSPSGLTLKYWYNHENALDIAIGNFGYYTGAYYPGFNMHVDYLWHRYGVFGSPMDAAYSQMPIYVGFGGLISNPGVAGARAVFGLTWLFVNPFDVFFELAPTLVVTPALGSGIDAGLGGRFYF